MRAALLAKLAERMRADRSVYVLTADTGFHVFDEFQQEFSDRYLNVGISEAAMIGVAAGLALSGARVFTYGIAPFVTMRCLEQIRVDLCYARLPVTIVGVGAGFTYGPAGVTHHSLEDIAVLSALPNMTIVCPGDPAEVRAAVAALSGLDGPCYLRLGKNGEPAVHETDPSAFALGRALRLREGEDPALLATGNMLPVAQAAADILAAQGYRPELISMHTVKPLDECVVRDLAARCRLIATVEEHNIIGGLGSMVAGVLSEAGGMARLARFGVPDRYTTNAGSQAALRRRYGLTPERIAGELAGRLQDGGRPTD